jgi:hypothetical protein
VLGFDAVRKVLHELGFKIGERLSRSKIQILRSDDTKINNAYLDGNHENIRVKMNQSFSPEDYFNKNIYKKLTQESKYGPGNIFETFNDD